MSWIGRLLLANANGLWTWIGSVGLVFVVHHGVGRGDPSLGLALSSAALPALVVALAPRRAQARVMLATMVVMTIVALVNAVYHRFFHRFLPLQSFSAAGESMKLTSYLPGLVRASDLGVLAIGLVTLAVMRFDARFAPRMSRRWTFALPVACALIGIGPALRWAWVISPRAYDSDSGGFIYAAIVDARRIVGVWTVSSEPSAAEWARVRRATQRTEPAPTDPWFGMAAGSSVIVIKVEGMNGWLLDADVEGQPVMPFLRSLAAGGISFTDLFDATREGHSSDADYMIMGSQLPLEHGALALMKPTMDVMALPRVLGPLGYASFSGDPGSPAGWNVAVRHRAYGFQDSRFGLDLGSGERIGLGMPDRSFLRRMEPIAERLHKPFLVWMHTATMHGPHRNFPDSLRTLAVGPLEGTPLGTYLQQSRYTDDAIREFIASLEAAGAMAHTTLMVYGDHTELFEFDMTAVRRLAGLGDVSEATAGTRLQKIPLIIVPPAARGGVRGGGRVGAPGGVRIPTVGSLVDASPTLLHLLGLPAPASWLGRSLLPARAGFTETRSGDVMAADRAWLDAGSCRARPDDAPRPVTDCDALRAQARERQEVSWLITRYGLAKGLDAPPAR